MPTLSKAELNPDNVALEPYAPVHDYIDRHTDEYIEEVRRFLRIPGFSDTGVGIRESAEACLGYIKMLGSTDAKLVDVGGHPVVFGKLRSKRPDAKTMLLYSLYDQVPVDPSEWASDPLGAQIVNASAIGMPAELGDVICNRAAHNQRGPMLSSILALKAMQEVEGDIPVNVVWCWEGEEEIGSPNLYKFVEQYQDELRKCDGMWMPSMRQNGLGSMVIPRGYKGVMCLELECKGGDWGGTVDGRHTWAGHAPWVDAPMMLLIHAVGSIFDADHNVVIDDVVELVAPLSDQDKREISTIRDAFTDEVEQYWKQVIGIKQFRGGRKQRDLIERWITAVTGNVQGIVGGYMGPTFYTMLPQRVVAKLDFRVPPGPTLDQVLQLLRAHLDRRGFTEVEIREARGYESIRTPTDHPLIQAGIRAAEMHGVSTSILPSTNAGCPAAMFDRIGLGIPASFVGIGHGERPHQPDEYICVDAIPALMKFTVTYLNEWAKS
jgi:acetylornithine deacetylase/succinyl-diaminopimelate desuccinylase-like protein